MFDYDTSTKLSKSIGIFAKTRKYLDRKTLIQLYYSFLYPYILYGNIVWGGVNLTTIKTIERFQRIAVRMIFNVRRRESITAICKKNQIIKVQDLHEYVVSIFMHKVANEEIPKFFTDLFKRNTEIHCYTTRQNDQLHVPMYKSAVGNRFIVKTGTTIWNEICSRGMNSVKMGRLKINVKAEILARY